LASRGICRAMLDCGVSIPEITEVVDVSRSQERSGSK
jgi:hypothetical protein